MELNLAGSNFSFVLIKAQRQAQIPDNALSRHTNTSPSSAAVSENDNFHESVNILYSDLPPNYVRKVYICQMSQCRALMHFECIIETTFVISTRLLRLELLKWLLNYTKIHLPTKRIS